MQNNLLLISNLRKFPKNTKQGQIQFVFVNSTYEPLGSALIWFESEFQINFIVNCPLLYFSFGFLALAGPKTQKLVSK